MGEVTTGSAETTVAATALEMGTASNSRSPGDGGECEPHPAMAGSRSLPARSTSAGSRITRSSTPSEACAARTTESSAAVTKTTATSQIGCAS